MMKMFVKIPVMDSKDIIIKHARPTELPVAISEGETQLKVNEVLSGALMSLL